MKPAAVVLFAAAFAAGALAHGRCPGCVQPEGSDCENPGRVEVQAEPEIRLLPDWTVAGITGTGGEDEIISALYRLVRWVATGNLPMVGRPFVRYEDDPDAVAAESLSFEVGVPVLERAARLEEAGIRVRNWGGFRVAVLGHTGPRDGLAGARERLRDRVGESGWEVAGAAVEFFLDLPGDVPAESLRTEVAYPVSRAE